MIRIQDFGELVYGGGVTLAEWWDNKRIEKGTLTDKQVHKKASFYTYLGVGLAATLMSTFGWMRRYERWAEHISHGFLYDVPRFAMNLNKSLSSAGSYKSNSAAIQEAQRIMKARQAQGALPAGRQAERSYQREFEAVAPHAF